MLALAQEVQSALDRHLGFQFDHNIDLELVDTLGKPLNENLRESGRFVRVNDHYTIKILRGLSREMCLETIAHELGHAWQAENIPGMHETIWQEGFAQWTAAKMLKLYRMNNLLDRLESRDDLYGEGYRRVAKLEKRYGKEGMLTRLKNRYRP
jgi:hypothetical protein